MAAIHGVIGTAAIFSMQASISASLAHTAIRIFHLFLSPTNQRAQHHLRLFSWIQDFILMLLIQINRVLGTRNQKRIDVAGSQRTDAFRPSKHTLSLFILHNASRKCPIFVALALKRDSIFDPSAVREGRTRTRVVDLCHSSCKLDETGFSMKYPVVKIGLEPNSRGFYYVLRLRVDK